MTRGLSFVTGCRSDLSGRRHLLLSCGAAKQAELNVVAGDQPIDIVEVLQHRELGVANRLQFGTTADRTPLGLDAVDTPLDLLQVQLNSLQQLRFGHLDALPRSAATGRSKQTGPLRQVETVPSRLICCGRPSSSMET